jgi:hypothetical protein
MALTAHDFSTDGIDGNKLFSVVSTGLEFKAVACKEFFLLNFFIILKCNGELPKSEIIK